MILSVEPMESLRYLPFLKKGGWIVTNTTPFVNIPNYPELNDVMQKVRETGNFIAIDADKIAKDLGASRSMNIVMLGAASPFIDIPFENFEAGIRDIFGKKGEEVVQKNLDALHAGRDFAENNK